MALRSERGGYLPQGPLPALRSCTPHPTHERHETRPVQARQRPGRGHWQPAPLVAVAAGGLIMGKPLTMEDRLRGLAARQPQADAFARSMAGTIAELERAGITSANATAKALNARGVAPARSGRWDAYKVIALQRRLKRLGL